MTKKQNSMVEANLKIIEELKFFLDAVSEDADIRKLVTQSDGDFSRDRKLPMERIVDIVVKGRSAAGSIFLL